VSTSACLFDASVWVALAFSSHPHHAEARREFDTADFAGPAVFCRATQQAFLRILTTPAIQKIYGCGVITNDDAWEKWELLIALPQVVWLDEPHGLETLWQKLARLTSASPKVWMDAYLAAFAITAGLRMATLDGDFKKFKSHGLDLRLLNR
jgi:toxin-antitoxin system PIN domain toxin